MGVIGNNPYPEALFCPGCGSNIEHHQPDLVQGDFSWTIILYQCSMCGHIVQEGFWLNLAEAKDKFGD